MTEQQSARPVILLRFFQMLAVLGAVPFLINTIDILLHPLAQPLDSAMTSRLFSGLLVAPLTLAISVLCIRRAPGNLIGWMLVTFGYGTSLLSMRPGLIPLPLTLFLGNWFIGAFWLAYLLIPLYFPDGRLYPPHANRWGNTVVSITIFFLVFVTNIFSPTFTYGMGPEALSAPNPFFVVEWDYTVVTIPWMVGFIVAGIVTVFLRYRNSQELERLQLRWLFFGVLVQAGLALFSFFAPEQVQNSISWAASLYTLILPIAIGIAILRYRLYDIDILIRRTLIYTILTGLLAAVYFGGVVLFQDVFRVLTGQETPLAIVLSTLIIAALFNPLRRRIQTVIDRRFFRKKYDAEQTMQAFLAESRQEVGLDQLGQSLVTAVQETIQPESVSFWLRSSGNFRARRADRA